MKVLTCFAAAMLLGECTSAHAQTAGSLDPIFNTTVTDIGTGSITSFVEQPDGKIWIGGHFREVGGTFKFNLARLFPDGSLETNNISANDGVEALVHQPDGKMIVAGNFSGVNSGTETRNKIARLNADGSMEAASTFNIGNGANYTISCAALQPDGKILLGGTFTTFNLSQRNHLVRLNANGSVESTTTFNAGTGTNGDIFSIVVQPDGKILIAGLFTSVNGQPRNRIARLLPNGSLEDTGTFNPGAGANDIVYCLSLQPDGKILAGGKFTSFGGQTRNRIARLNPDGTLESTATFDPGTGANDYLNCFALQTDGKILVGGSFTQMNGQTRNGLARLLPNGSLESTATFQTGTGVSGGEVPGVRSIAVQSNGKILIGGYFDKVNGTTRYGMARLFNDPATHRLSVEGGRVQWLRGGSSPEASNVNFELSTNGGTVWSSLGAGTRIAGGWERTGVSLPAAGQIRARGRTAGGIYGVSSGIVEEIASFGPGSLDVSFSPVLQGGVSGSFVNALAVQPDGKILIGGDFLTIDGQSRTNIARLLADGSVEPLSSFAIGSGASSDLSSLIVQPDGKILAAGRFNQLNGRARPFIGRLLPDGSVEGSATFTTGTGPANVVFASAIQPDGKILIAGNFHSVDGHSRNYIARLEAGGAVESSSTFNVGTGADSYITALAVQPDGRILAGGDFSNFNGQARGRIVRLLSNGTLETTAAFNTGSGANAQVSCLAVQPDGKILVGGAFTTIDGRTRNRIARLNTDGSLESSTTFPSGTGANGSLSSILLQADGKIIVGGGFTTFNDLPRNQVTRLLTSGVPESLTVFNTGSGFDQGVGALTLQEDGRILAGGNFATANGIARTRLARLNNDPAIRSLEIPDRTRVVWMRGGTSPEVEQVTFELSLNGTQWTTLGTGQRISGGWQRTALTLPPHGTIRARGRAACGSNNVSSSLFETLAVFDFPVPEIEIHADAAPGDGGINSGQSTPVDFGTTRQTMPASLPFTVSNPGTAGLIIADVAVPAGFSVADLPPAPLSIEPGASLTFRVVLDAALPGSFAGTVSISSNDEDESSFVFPVTGLVVTPEIAVHEGSREGPELADGQTAKVDFGKNVQGTPATRSFTLANTGSAELKVTSITVPSGYSALNVPTLPFTIGIAQSANVQISLTTTSVGTYSGSVLIASDDLDETVFDFPITGEVFIPEPVSSVATATTTLNRQTGLREQTIHITNDTTATVPAYNLVIRGLPAGVEVNNASETRPDGSFVIYVRQGMQPHSSQDIVIEYYSPDRNAVEVNPQLSTEVVLNPPDLTAAPEETGLAINVVKRLAGGEMLLEFASTPGKRYQVQYSADGQSWQNSLPQIKAASNRTQWIDRGLPRTDSPPAQAGSRMYRVRETAP